MDYWHLIRIKLVLHCSHLQRDLPLQKWSRKTFERIRNIQHFDFSGDCGLQSLLSALFGSLLRPRPHRQRHLLQQIDRVFPWWNIWVFLTRLVLLVNYHSASLRICSDHQESWIHSNKTFQFTRTENKHEQRITRARLNY